MHKVFAIEPQAIDSWDVAQYLLEKFDYSKGTLIGLFPTSWARLVIESCDKNGIKDISRTKLIEKLNQLKTKKNLVKLGVNFDTERDWLENTLDDEVIDIFSKVIISNHVGHKQKLPNKIFNINERDESWFSDCQHFSPKRSSKELANVAEWVVKNAKSLDLIDPYFQCKQNNTKVLIDIINKISTQNPFTVNIHVCEKDHPSVEVSMVQYENLLKSLLDIGWSFKIHIWKEIESDRHPRFLISDYAGLMYDRGFIEPNDRDDRNKETIVDCISNVRIRSELDKYNLDSPDLTRILEIGK